MDLEDVAPPNPATTRPSTAHDRPSRAPFGPRRPKHAHDMDTIVSSTLSSPIDPAPQRTLSSRAQADVAVQTPSTPPPPPIPEHVPSPPTSPPSKAAPTRQKTPTTTFIPPPPLTPAPAISFESTPIPWKGLPLDAAQWTFSSAELQEIVSKAIRLSARESFVRLLSLQALEVDIVHESQRLEVARLEAQAKWRFQVGRRTMLMQALNASAAFSVPTPGEHPAEGGSPIAGFVGQLASAIAACDSLLSTILQISDQQSQIALIQHQHWASALGMALRKLNKAHERQAEELRRVQTRVQTLEDELEEAWREAEKMAIEFDDLEQEIAESASERGSEVAVDEGPEQDAEAHVDLRPDLVPRHDVDETGTLGDMTIRTDIAVVLGVTATAVASKATLVTSPASPKPVDKSDTRSIRSVKSTRSRRSTRDGQSHVSRLSSARVRSRAASNASLRLPKALRSTSSTHTSPVDAPPIPALPPPTVQGQSFLDMDSVMQEHIRKSLPPKRHPEPTLALPTPPHSAGLPETRVPSIWVETDGGKSTRLSALDRSHSLQIFSSLAPRKMRRSNLVMSLKGSDRGSDGVASASGSGSGSGSGSPITENQTSAGNGNGMGTATASPTSTHSPVSLPTHALAHFRGPSLSSSSHSMGASSGVVPRPGSAGARLTTTREETRGVPARSPRKSLVSRASSVILRRLSQATMGNGGGSRAMMGGGKGTASGRGLLSPSRSREALRSNGGGRALVERWKDRAREGDGLGNRLGEEGEEEGEVMLIGSPHADPFDAP